MAAIDYFSYGHPLSWLRTHFAMRARKRMFDLFMEWAQPQRSDRVLDLGVTPDVSLKESNFFEQYYPHKDQIVAASIEDASNLETVFPGVRFQLLTSDRLPFEDKAFKYLFCSAVVEHVGDREQQRKFLSELARVSDHFFVTTPNRWFPLEFHTILPLIHWLPQPVHHRLLRIVGMKQWANINVLNLLSEQDLLSLFPTGTRVKIRKVRLACLTSNLIALGSG